jgi:hypothetical protein
MACSLVARLQVELRQAYWIGGDGRAICKGHGGRVAVISSTKQKEARAHELGAERFIHEGAERIDKH